MLDKSIFKFLFANMREMSYNFQIHKNFWWKKYFHYIFKLNNATVPHYTPIKNWKKSRFLFKMYNKINDFNYPILRYY